MTKLFDKRRAYVNQKFAEETKGRNISNRKKTKILRKLWKEAKKKIK